VNPLDDPSLFDGNNPFQGEPGASRALSWERAHWRLKLKELQEAHIQELQGLRGEREGMRAELEGALEACGAFPTFDPALTDHDKAQGRTWSRLLALVGFLAGKASVPPMQVIAPAKAARKARK